MILPETVQQTITALELRGFEAYAVGGAVRDFLLGNEPTDWDIATSALPQDVMETLGTKNCIPTGIKHGTVTYIAQNQVIEITTYRIDGEYSDNRHPETVTFSTDICDDLNRRDFTVNAMAYNPKVGLVDPFGGQKDLSAGIIRTVGDAVRRFSEDGLRIMRGLRFASTLGFEIEPKTSAAIHQCRHLLRNIAKERIQSELSKLVSAECPEFILTNFCDVFKEIFELCSDFSQNRWRENARRLSASSHGLAVRLAILLDGISQNTRSHQLLKHLKYDNKTVSAVKTIEEYIDFEILPDTICIKHLLSEIGLDNFRLVLEAKRIKYNADISEIIRITDEIISNNCCFAQKQLTINGNDLISLGISGTQIGRILKLLLREVIEERCINEKSALLQLAENLK